VDSKVLEPKKWIPKLTLLLKVLDRNTLRETPKAKLGAAPRV